MDRRFKPVCSQCGYPMWRSDEGLWICGNLMCNYKVDEKEGGSVYGTP